MHAAEKPCPFLTRIFFCRITPLARHIVCVGEQGDFAVGAHFCATGITILGDVLWGNGVDRRLIEHDAQLFN